MDEREKQIREEIAELEDEIESDECLRNTSDFHHVEDRLEENKEKLKELKEAIGE